MLTLQELADDLRKIVDFRYITSDTHGIKLWSTKPEFEGRRGFWHGPERSWRGAIAIEAVPNLKENDASIIDMNKRGNDEPEM